MGVADQFIIETITNFYFSDYDLSRQLKRCDTVIDNQAVKLGNKRAKFWIFIANMQESN